MRGSGHRHQHQRPQQQQQQQQQRVSNGRDGSRDIRGADLTGVGYDQDWDDDVYYAPASRSRESSHENGVPILEQCCSLYLSLCFALLIHVMCTLISCRAFTSAEGVSCCCWLLVSWIMLCRLRCIIYIVEYSWALFHPPLLHAIRRSVQMGLMISTVQHNRQCL